MLPGRGGKISCKILLFTQDSAVVAEIAELWVFCGAAVLISLGRTPPDIISRTMILLFLLLVFAF